MDHQAVLERVVAWARRDPNIRALVLTGSLAREDGTADEYSDLDLELYVSDASQLLGSDAWYHQFGEVLVVEALENPGWHPTRLVYYADGKIDFMVAPVSVLGDGASYDQPYHVLLDKDAFAGAFRAASPARNRPPSPAELLECIHWFYAAALMWAKYLVRGDLWAAKVRDWDSKAQLLRMIEWDLRARNGWDYDTRHHGVRLRDWLDPELMTQVAQCWAGASFTDQARALRASLALFESLSTRTAAAIGVVPFDAVRVRERIERLLARMEGTY